LQSSGTAHFAALQLHSQLARSAHAAQSCNDCQICCHACTHIFTSACECVARQPGMGGLWDWARSLSPALGYRPVPEPAFESSAWPERR